MRGVRALTQKLALNLASIFIVSGSDESRVPQMIDFPGSRCPDVANTPLPLKTRSGKDLSRTDGSAITLQQHSAGVGTALHQVRFARHVPWGVCAIRAPVEGTMRVTNTAGQGGDCVGTIPLVRRN